MLDHKNEKPSVGLPSRELVAWLHRHYPFMGFGFRRSWLPLVRKPERGGRGYIGHVAYLSEILKNIHTSQRKVMVWSSCHVHVPDVLCVSLTVKQAGSWRQHPLFSICDVFTCLYPCLLPTEVPSSRPGISTGTRSASCVLTVTSTSSRKATSSWRGSCIVRRTPEPARGPQKATTPSLCTPKLKSFTDADSHARMRARAHTYKLRPMAWRLQAVTSQSKAGAF